MLALHDAGRPYHAPPANQTEWRSTRAPASVGGTAHHVSSKPRNRINLAVEGEHGYFRTSARTCKIKRISRNPTGQLAPCAPTGRVTGTPIPCKFAYWVALRRPRPSVRSHANTPLS